MIIRGSTVGTTVPRPDYAQTDEAHASFIRNKPDAAISRAQSTADSAKSTAQAALPRTGGTMTGAIDMGGNSVTNLAAPAAQSDAANKGYVDSKVSAAHMTAQLTIPASGWTGTAAPYSQSIPVTGLLASDHPHIGCLYSGDRDTSLMEREAWAMVWEATATDDTLTLLCLEDKPVVDLTIQLEVNR